VSRLFHRARGPFLRLNLPPLSRWQVRPRPFFRLLRELLDHEGEVTLGHVAEVAQEQTCGLLVLFLALPSLVPGLNVGTAPIGGVGIMAIGAQMAQGNAHPWLPQRVRRQVLHKGKTEEALARLEAILDRFRLPKRKRRALNLRWTGVLIVWIGFLLALPVPLPFANILPAAVLCLVGAALLEERSSWGWLGAVAAIGTTIYFAASFRFVLAGLKAAAHSIHRMLS
jgi:hypothetical protein